METDILIQWIQAQASNHGGFFTILVAVILPFYQRSKANLRKVRDELNSYLEEQKQYRSDHLTHEEEMIEILKDIKSNTRQ